MFDTHERILQRLHDTGMKEFSVETVKEAMNKVEDEEIDSMYQDWLKHEEAEAKEREQWRADEITLDRIERSGHEAEAEPVSWADAAEGLDIPHREHSHDREMEW